MSRALTVGLRPASTMPHAHGGLEPLYVAQNPRAQAPWLFILECQAVSRGVSATWDARSKSAGASGDETNAVCHLRESPTDTTFQEVPPKPIGVLFVFFSHVYAPGSKARAQLQSFLETVLFWLPAMLNTVLSLLEPMTHYDFVTAVPTKLLSFIK